MDDFKGVYLAGTRFVTDSFCRTLVWLVFLVIKSKCSRFDSLFAPFYCLSIVLYRDRFDVYGPKSYKKLFCNLLVVFILYR